MTYIKSLPLCLILCVCTVIPCHAAPQARLAITGRVSLEGRSAPPRLTVRLYFPRKDRKPPVVTYTNDKGDFRFADLDSGRYLLEVYRGDEMVYQKVIELNQKQGQEPVLINLRVTPTGR